MTPGARITAGLLLVVAVVSLAFLFKSSATGPDAYLFGGAVFSQQEITNMEAAMAEAGLSGWDDSGNRLRVPSAIKTDCIAAIASAGALPANFSSFMDDALTDSGVMEPRRKWDFRTNNAREKQLSLIVSKMDWVESAQVMVDIQERRGFNRRNDASASVFITPRPGEMVDTMRLRNIQKLVAGPFTDMVADSVQVSTSTGEIGGFGEPLYDDPYLQAREEVQKSYRSRLMELLNFIPNVRVQVSANLDNRTSSTVTKTTPGEPKAVRSESEMETEESTQNDMGGQIGLVAQGPARRGTEEALNRSNTKRFVREKSTDENALGFTQEVEDFVGFKPKELYASIAVPRDYVTDTWQQNNPDKSPGDLTDTDLKAMETDVKLRIERLVKNILPRLSLGEDEYKQVEVIFIDSIKRAAPLEPSIADTALAWTGQYWGTLSMIGLAGVSLLLLRSAIKPSDGSDGGNSKLELDFGNDEKVAGTDEEEEQLRPKLRIKKGESLKEDLSEMVREDPDAAANILRAWINHAG
ncbi:hypothetical protein NG895_25945 [Aeoliella sp. ICT_H6.2]|uniref:Flagellar M-ring N-terminal domain-containing protein n=1 Tax=Aeoliella straminimaris TaxID=2954799 RepID=A0A9X2FI08_9BACT|nr:hypothetical protein [Aeoliella straminimaris]MCO6047359.1 hypothetical protein [Aeoliella straminimaris]